jgi:uncharacterized protein
MLTTQLNPRPWYREPWPWLLMSLPLVAVIAGFITLSLAIHTEDGFVASDYDKEGLAINRQLQREQKAAQLGLRAEGEVDGSNRMRMHLSGKGVLPAALYLRLVHPTRSGMDQTLELRAAPDGWYEGHLQALQPAHWRLTLEDAGHTWRLDGSWNTATHGGITFPAL